MVPKHDEDDTEEKVVDTIVSRLPHIITATVAIGGLIAAYFMTIGEFRIKDLELQHKIEVLDTRIDIMSKQLTRVQTSIEEHSETSIPFRDYTEEKKQLNEEIKILKDLLLQTKNLLKAQK